MEGSSTCFPVMALATTESNGECRTCRLWCVPVARARLSLPLSTTHRLTRSEPETLSSAPRQVEPLDQDGTSWRGSADRPPPIHSLQRRPSNALGGVKCCGNLGNRPATQGERDVLRSFALSDVFAASFLPSCTSRLARLSPSTTLRGQSSCACALGPAACLRRHPRRSALERRLAGCVAMARPANSR
jgi:hypothetical protein